jgi:hypothetical protein
LSLCFLRKRIGLGKGYYSMREWMLSELGRTGILLGGTVVCCYFMRGGFEGLLDEESGLSLCLLGFFGYLYSEGPVCYWVIICWPPLEEEELELFTTL